MSGIGERPRPRRSCLSVPGSDSRKLGKAQDLGADEVVIDLEDSVLASAKDDALQLAAEAARNWSGPALSVRVNRPGSPWCHRELAALAAGDCWLTSVVVPKVRSAGELAFVDRLLDGAEAAGGRTRSLGVQVLIETAEGLGNIREIALASPRVESLIIGYADLAAELGRSLRAPGSSDLWLPAQHALVLAARQGGVQAIDGPYLGTAPDQAFVAQAGAARDLGFDGKWAIHPSQLGPLNELFTPTVAEIDHARAVLAALRRSEAEQGAGAVALGGEMLDEAVRRSAVRILARAGDAETVSPATRP